MKKIFAVLAIFTVFLFWACHLTSEEGETIIHVEGDAAWLTYDSLKIVLKDTSGNVLDILFDEKLASLDQLKTLSGKNIEGGEVVFYIQGFRGDTLVFEQNRKYSEKTGLAVVETTLVMGMALKGLTLTPDTLNLYLGGEEGLLKVSGSPIFAKPELLWSATGDCVDLVLKAGVWQATVKPKKEGVSTVTVHPKMDTALQKKLQVRIIKDTPVLTVSPSKVFITPGSKVEFVVKSSQAYGSLVDFRWKEESHAAWDDSLTGNWKDKETQLPSQGITFATAGIFKIDFHVKDSEGNESEVTALVDVGGRKPSVELAPKDTVISIKDTVFFQGTILEPGGKLASYTWDFNGDGKPEDSASLTDSSTRLKVSRSFPDSGVYKVKLRARDALGMLGEDSVTVTVQSDIPVLNPGLDTSAKSREAVSFRGTAMQKFGSIVMYKWDYQGDGIYEDSSSAPFTKSFAYPLEGTFKARFYVRDDDGNVVIGIRTIVISDAPFLILSKRADTTISIKDSIILSASIRNDDAKDLQYGWDFNGDGSLEDSASTSLAKITLSTGHRYLAPGNFKSILRVRDLAGTVLRETVLVKVELDPPMANLGSDTTVLVGTLLKLKLLGTDKFGPIATRHLEFGNSGLFIPISQQETTITVPATKGLYRIIGRVTDDDGQSAKDTLDIKVIYSPENRLATLFLSPPGTVLLPIFSSDSLVYNATVANTLASVVVGGVPLDKYASIAVNGTLLSASVTSVAVDLVFGLNAIPIVVTAQDSTTRTYTLNFKRMASTNANLLSLTTTPVTPINPVFDPAVLDYQDTVANTVTSIGITAKSQDANASITVDGVLVTPAEPVVSLKLKVGLNTIVIVVKAQDESIKTYTLNLVRLKSTNNALVSLIPKSGTLAPVFNAATLAYTLTLADDVDSVQGTATLADLQSTLSFAGTVVASGSLSPNTFVGVGSTVILIVVTAQDGTPRTYSITVKRAGWFGVGVASFSPAKTCFQAVAQLNGVLYAAFVDSVNNRRAMVMKKGPKDTGWTMLAAASVPDSATTVGQIRLFTHGGSLYLGYEAFGIASPQYYLKKWSGTSWIGVGGPIFASPYGHDSFHFAFDKLDSAYMVLQHSYMATNAFLYKLRGTTWTYLLSTADADTAHYPMLGVNQNTNTLYMAWIKYTATADKFLAAIDTLAGTTLVPVGITGWAIANTPIAFATDPSGVPYYVYAEATGKKISVKKLSGNTWINMGTAGFSDGEATSLRISFQGSVPVVSYRDASLKTAVVRMWNGTGWVAVGSPKITSTDPDVVDLATSGTSTWVGFGEKANGNRGTVLERILP